MMKDAMPTRGLRQEYIDSLRGVAITGVLLSHCGQTIDDLPPPLVALTNFGGNGVQLFFMLSALTLATVYRDGVAPLGRFFLRRFFRVAPMFYLGIILYLAINGIAPGQVYAPSGIGACDILLAFLLVQGWSIASFNAVVPGGWSISDEMMFYLSFPVLMRFIRSLPAALVWTALSMIFSRLCFIITPHLFTNTSEHIADSFAHFLFPTQLPAFLLGLVLYYFFVWLEEKYDFHRDRRIVTVGFLGTVATMVAVSLSGNGTLNNYLFVDCMLFGFVALTHLSRNRLVVNRWWGKIGLVSFSMYIAHFALLEVIAPAFLKITGHWAPAMRLLILFPLLFLASYAVATVTYRAIERSFIAIGRRFETV